MALFKPYKITSDKLNSLTIREGQFIIVTDTEEIYVDKSATERMIPITVTIVRFLFSFKFLHTSFLINRILSYHPLS